MTDPSCHPGSGAAPAHVGLPPDPRTPTDSIDRDARGALQALVGAVELLTGTRLSLEQAELVELAQEAVGQLIAAKPALARPRPAASPAARVLVVEDVPINQRIVERTLRRGAFDVQLVATGEEAVEACRNGEFDAVLMDVELPGIDGCEATRLIRDQEARDGHVPRPILAYSSKDQPEDLERSRAAGCDDFISKSVRGEELIEILRRRV